MSGYYAGAKTRELLVKTWLPKASQSLKLRAWRRSLTAIDAAVRRFHWVTLLVAISLSLGLAGPWA
jgi:hypothetical protein